MIHEIVTTIDNAESAKQIASKLIDEQLAACVQIDGPILSVYHWKENVEQAQEWRLTIKTLAAAQGAAIRRLKQLHPYDVPEILVHEASHVEENYLNWAKEQVRGDS